MINTHSRGFWWPKVQKKSLNSHLLGKFCSLPLKLLVTRARKTDRKEHIRQRSLKLKARKRSCIVFSGNFRP